MAQYIDKDALVAEIEKQRQLIFPRNTGEMKVADVPKPLEQGWLNALSWIKKTIDTLEVKEVDLNKEVMDWWNTYYNLKDYTFEGYAGHYLENSTIIDIAKHFFELGLKAQKGEKV